jgi:cytochrome c-type biogenesis protein CcmE
VSGRLRLVGASIVALAAMSMVLVGTVQSSVPFLSPADVDDSFGGRRIQVEGLVRDLEAVAGGLRFALSDGTAAVAVDYRYGAGRPLALDVGRLAIAKGIYRDGVIVAQQVSIRAHEGVEGEANAHEGVAAEGVEADAGRR